MGGPPSTRTVMLAGWWLVAREAGEHASGGRSGSLIPYYGVSAGRSGPDRIVSRATNVLVTNQFSCFPVTLEKLTLVRNALPLILVLWQMVGNTPMATCPIAFRGPGSYLDILRQY